MYVCVITCVVCVYLCVCVCVCLCVCVCVCVCEIDPLMDTIRSRSNLATRDYISNSKCFKH